MKRLEPIGIPSISITRHLGVFPMAMVTDSSLVRKIFMGLTPKMAEKRARRYIQKANGNPGAILSVNYKRVSDDREEPLSHK